MSIATKLFQNNESQPSFLSSLELRPLNKINISFSLI